MLLPVALEPLVDQDWDRLAGVVAFSWGHAVDPVDLAPNSTIDLPKFIVDLYFDFDFSC